MKRRTLATLSVAASLLAAAFSPMSLPAAFAQQPKTLKMVAHADLKILDPTFTTAYITRNFGYMVYDTLYGQDDKGKPHPQMIEKQTTSADGKSWSFKLRPGMKYSDGTPVTSADAVASIERWASRDGFGGVLKSAGAVWKVVDQSNFTVTLNEPISLMLEGLSKPSSFPLFVLPERLARMPTTTPLSEVLGSGPFLFKRDEWMPGNKVVFVRNPNYVARTEAPSGLAGSKKPALDRVEWLYLPDANSATAALKKGEVDMIEQVPPDYINPLRTDPNITVFASGRLQAQLIMNQAHAPFNNPKVRAALLQAVNQERFVASVGVPLDMRMSYCATYFICGSANDTGAGADSYRKADVAKAKQMLADSGYKGEKVVLLMTSDVTYLNALSLMTLQTMRSIGLNVDPQTMDWASIGARRAKKDAPASGGWSAYSTVAVEFSTNSPIDSLYLGASCGNSLPGWPCDKTLDELRSAWVKETTPAKRRAALDAFQKRAYEVVPYINLGQYSQALAARKTLKGTDKLWGGLPALWVLDK